MKGNFIKLAAVSYCLLAQTASYAGSGQLFNVSATGAPAVISITLCLNARGPLSCQTYTVNAMTLSISTVIPNHVYPYAGIKVNTPGYTSTGCTALANGYCSFTASSTTSASVMVTSNDSSAIAFVGSYYTGSATNPLSYTSSDSGNTWAVSSPLPALPVDGVNGALYRTACDSSKTMCVAVGRYYNGSASLPLTYTSSNGGHTWALSTSLPAIPGGATSAYLRDVSCDSAGSHCVAVGAYFNGSENFALVYSTDNGGSSWTQRSLPPTLMVSINEFLGGVACSSSGSVCVAVGYVATGSDAVPLVYTTNNGGNSWTLSASLPVPTFSTNSNYLQSVACDSAGSRCAAVGHHYDGSFSTPLTYTSNNAGVTWVLSSPQPSIPGGGSQGYLFDVACGGAGNACTAVGTYNDGSTGVPLIYISSDGGASWASREAIVPAGGTNGSLYLVSCNGSGSACSAGGSYRTGGTSVPLTFTSSNGGSSWALSSLLPITPAGGEEAMLGSESA